MHVNLNRLTLVRRIGRNTMKVYTYIYIYKKYMSNVFVLNEIESQYNLFRQLFYISPSLVLLREFYGRHV